jgi:hypothetical protein
MSVYLDKGLNSSRLKSRETHIASFS